jgi:hypothetical protein
MENPPAIKNQKLLLFALSIAAFIFHAGWPADTPGGDDAIPMMIPVCCWQAVSKGGIRVLHPHSLSYA